jgi:prepilin peptidase CpaA
MQLQLHFLPLIGFAGLMVLAALEDLRRLVIPNTVTGGLCALWMVYLLLAPNASLTTALGAGACSLVVLFAGALLFARGWIGGGDVKLMAAATLWAGPTATLAFLAMTGLLGGLLALLLLSPVGAHVAAVQRALPRPPHLAANPGDPVAIPYGVAIAAAALIVTLPHGFSN